MNGGDYDGTATEVYQMRTTCLQISSFDIFNGTNETETAVFLRFISLVFVWSLSWQIIGFNGSSTTAR